MKRKLLFVAAARPNFMKVAPVYRQLKESSDFDFFLVHTGQHYDSNMSDIFFEELGLPTPNYHLGVSGGSQSQQMAKVIAELENILANLMPDMVVVVGDVNATAAAAITAANCGIPVAHIESGLRSNDFGMPEERNRRITDALSSLHFVSEPSGIENLLREGVGAESIHMVGNVMIDSLLHYQTQFADVSDPLLDKLAAGSFVIVTMHRPSNVDNSEGLLKINELIGLLEKSGLKVLFPVHPRTKQAAAALSFNLGSGSTIKTPPLGYANFVGLMKRSAGVVTDSGGIQEETSFLGIPCVTFRANTERPITIEKGTNQLVPQLDPKKAAQLLIDAIAKPAEDTQIPFWDGKAAERIVEILRQFDFAASKTVGH